jgi:hypothetical protein
MRSKKRREAEMKTFTMTIVFAAFAWTATASTSVQNTTHSQTAVENTQLAQAGGRFCPKGYRWDGRQHQCVRVG